jgi:HD superfamily phosphohydrolase YqeK
MPGPADVLAAAADGRLPDWAQAHARRRAHMARVAGVMDAWANRLGLSAAERARWRATAWLHDALRDAPADALRAEVEARFRDLPGTFLHGPVTATRLEAGGLDDADVLDAIRWHTLGRAGLGRLGLVLIAADALEPGRTDRPVWRAVLRGRMPAAFDAVVDAVIRDRIEGALRRGAAVRPELLALWNARVSGASSA